jgi:hypothetical protein
MSLQGQTSGVEAISERRLAIMASLIAMAIVGARTSGHKWPATSGARAAIGAIPDDAWTPIRYPRAIWDDRVGVWVSDAEVAETTCKAARQISGGKTTPGSRASNRKARQPPHHTLAGGSRLGAVGDGVACSLSVTLTPAQLTALDAAGAAIAGNRAYDLTSVSAGRE